MVRDRLLKVDDHQEPYVEKLVSPFLELQVLLCQRLEHHNHMDNIVHMHHNHYYNIAPNWYVDLQLLPQQLLHQEMPKIVVEQTYQVEDHNQFLALHNEQHDCHNIHMDSWKLYLVHYKYDR
jgi:hypothetical protein